MPLPRSVAAVRVFALVEQKVPSAFPALPGIKTELRKNTVLPEPLACDTADSAASALGATGSLLRLHIRAIVVVHLRLIDLYPKTRLRLSAAEAQTC